MVPSPAGPPAPSSIWLGSPVHVSLGARERASSLECAPRDRVLCLGAAGDRLV